MKVIIVNYKNYVTALYSQLLALLYTLKRIFHLFIIY